MNGSYSSSGTSAENACFKTRLGRVAMEVRNQTTNDGPTENISTFRFVVRCQAKGQVHDS